MDKRKVMSKARLTKPKIEVSKTLLDQLSSDSFNRIAKVHQPQDQLKKSITPTPSRTPKPKSILNKRPSDTPKLKIEDLDVKRRSVPNTQDNLEAYYSTYIKALTTKLDKHKKRNQELEEDLKQMELSFKLEEGNLKKEIDRLNLDAKKIRREKSDQETMLMEENFRIRKEYEEYKIMMNQGLNEIIPLVQAASEKCSPELDEIFCEITKKIFEISVKEEESYGPRLSLKDTASFSNVVVVDVYSPKAAVQSCFKEAIVLYSHKSENVEELELKVGDRVTVFNSDDVNEWWIGKVRDDIGKFPRNCVMLD